MKKKYKILITIFIILQIILAILAQTTSGLLNTIILYSIVVLAFLWPFLFFVKSNDFIYTIIGLLFTLGADFFLVILDPIIEIPAMICFSITQICYFLKIYTFQKDKEKRVHLIVRIILIITVIVFTIILLAGQVDLLTLLSAFYYANLLCNIIFAFTQYKKSILFPIGLLLFALCDLQVGLNYLNDYYLSLDYIPLFNLLFNSSLNIAWIFYAPSQMLISLSIMKSKKEFS